MQCEDLRQALRILPRPDPNGSLQHMRRSIRKKPRARDDRFVPNLKKVYSRVPWMRFSHRGVDLSLKYSKSRVLVTEVLPFGHVVLQHVADKETKPNDTSTCVWSGSGSESRNRGRWCARLSIANLVPNAEELILNKEFDAIWQGDNVVLMDGKFDITPRLGARPKPSADLPVLNTPIPAALVAWQGCHLAIQNKDVTSELNFLDNFEKDLQCPVLEHIEKRSYLLVWDNWRWKRAQVKECESASPTLLVTLIDEAIDKTIPRVEDLLGVAPTTWLQPPAGGILVGVGPGLPKFDVNDFADEEVFCVLRKPVGNTRYAGQLFIKSEDGKLVDIAERYRAIPPSTPQLGLSFVMHVDNEGKKLHVVSSQFMDEHGTYLTEKLAELVQRRPLLKVKQGQAVLALMFDLLCRAEVQNIRADGIVVKFVDYGNTAVVNTVFAIPDDLVKVPALAFELPMELGKGGQFEFGMLLTVSSIEAGSIKFARLE